MQHRGGTPWRGDALCGSSGRASGGPACKCGESTLCSRSQAARLAPRAACFPSGRALLSGGGHVSRPTNSQLRPPLRLSWGCTRAPWRRRRPWCASSFGGRRPARLLGSGRRRLCAGRLAERRWSRRLVFSPQGAPLRPSAAHAEPKENLIAASQAYPFLLTPLRTATEGRANQSPASRPEIHAWELIRIRQCGAFREPKQQKRTIPKGLRQETARVAASPLGSFKFLSSPIYRHLVPPCLACDIEFC